MEARAAAPGAHHLDGPSLASLAFFGDRLASPLARLAFLTFLRRKVREVGRAMMEARFSSKKAMGKLGER